MPTVSGYHDVKDTDHWPPRRSDPTNRARVALLMDVPDMDAVVAAMETSEAAEAMADDGVLPETLVIPVEA